MKDVNARLSAIKERAVKDVASAVFVFGIAVAKGGATTGQAVYLGLACVGIRSLLHQLIEFLTTDTERMKAERGAVPQKAQRQ